MLNPVDPRTIRFEPEPLLQKLAEGGVVFVVIGGMAALLHGDIAGTADIDAAVDEQPDNIRRLIAVLDTVDAHVLVDVGAGQMATLDVPIDSVWFERMTSLRLLTCHGVLDVVLHADGVGRHTDWVRNAQQVDLDGAQIAVAALDDIIRSKTAANRPKDIAALPRLHELLRRSQHP